MRNRCQPLNCRPLFERKEGVPGLAETSGMRLQRGRLTGNGAVTPCDSLAWNYACPGTGNCFNGLASTATLPAASRVRTPGQKQPPGGCPSEWQLLFSAARLGKNRWFY